jgi:hypothetical protein
MAAGGGGAGESRLLGVHHLRVATGRRRSGRPRRG